MEAERGQKKALNSRRSAVCPVSSAWSAGNLCDALYFILFEIFNNRFDWNFQLQS
jgi:hypothetical protein